MDVEGPSVESHFLEPLRETKIVQEIGNLRYRIGVYKITANQMWLELLQRLGNGVFEKSGFLCIFLRSPTI